VTNYLLKGRAADVTPVSRCHLSHVTEISSLWLVCVWHVVIGKMRSEDVGGTAVALKSLTLPVTAEVTSNVVCGHHQPPLSCGVKCPSVASGRHPTNLPSFLYHRHQSTSRKARVSPDLLQEWMGNPRATARCEIADQDGGVSLE
jgi:hypothetical protein